MLQCVFECLLAGLVLICQGICVHSEWELWYRLWLCLITNQPWALWWQKTSAAAQSAEGIFLLTENQFFLYEPH